MWAFFQGSTYSCNKSKLLEGRLSLPSMTLMQCLSDQQAAGDDGGLGGGKILGKAGGIQTPFLLSCGKHRYHLQTFFPCHSHRGFSEFTDHSFNTK